MVLMSFVLWMFNLNVPCVGMSYGKRIHLYIPDEDDVIVGNNEVEVLQVYSRHCSCRSEWSL